MLRTFINSFKVSFAQNANTFIYFLKRIPLVGKKIPEKLYKQTQAKLIIGVIREIIGILGGFFRKSLYLGLMIVLPSYLITKDIAKLMPTFLHILFFLSFVLGPLMHTTIFNPKNKSAFDMLTLMRADAREYYLGEVLYRNVKDFIYFTIPLIIVGVIIGFSSLKAVVLIAELIAFRFIGEWLHLFTYTKTGKILTKNNYFMTLVIIGGLALGYASPILGFTIDFQPLLFNIFLMFIVLALSVVAFIYLWKYKGYTPIAKELLTKDNLFNPETFKAEIKFADVKLDEKKMTKEDLNSKIYDKKQGYEYLNSLFFLRHRRIMVTPIKRRVALITVLFLIGISVVLFIPDKSNELVWEIQKSTPLLVFLMYLMSTGERICKAMFFNCDVSLLRYSYYREGNVILSNFTSRLKRVIFLNIIPALTLCVALADIVVASNSGAQLIGMIPLFLCILCLSCFFSIHHLFMYYVIQPYTAELTVKSPLFKFINVVVYLLSYTCLQIKTSSYYFTLGVLIITIVYMAIALILTYRVAPRTFKLKL